MNLVGEVKGYVALELEQRDANFYVCGVSEMAIDMLGSILVTRSMDLVSITLLMGTVTRAHGTKAVSKGMECTPSEVGKPDAVNGTVVRLKHPYGRLQIQCSKQFR